MRALQQLICIKNLKNIEIIFYTKEPENLNSQAFKFYSDLDGAEFEPFIERLGDFK